MQQHSAYYLRNGARKNECVCVSEIESEKKTFKRPGAYENRERKEVGIKKKSYTYINGLT